ncbi:glycerophosphoryl diester phosphodiesterase membrane domain-containing protein [Hazenella sp. IB182353]|uniref:glycerophosphoryl diester phosphodiesterase membrane domain-containing protein n=1 Tax=Polycladospora coralii TaxID=2771432 RepID=UPI001746D086|nr:glycerophosphoryl diester phosphodiesterase membrane domain-containing protein [Polycladospora coralii]MBS7528984.1 glycerophosphoryl diester phosphodiesterase membrane domain-containing protein [Polycladospora coralii]
MRYLHFTELIDGTFRLLRLHFKKLYLLSFCFSLPFLALEVWWIIYQTESLRSGENSDTFFYYLGGSIQYFFVLFLLYPILQYASLQMLNQEELRGTSTIKKTMLHSFRAIFAHLPFILILTAISGVIISSIWLLTPHTQVDIAGIVFLCELLIALLASYFFIRFALTIPVFMMERRTLRFAIKKSWTLSRGKVWQTFGALFFLGMFKSLIAMLSMSFLDWALWDLAYLSLLWYTIGSLITIGIGPILFLFTPLYIALFYQNQLILTEATDIKEQIRRLTPDRR